MADPEAVMGALIRAVGEVAAGREADGRGLRALITAELDQLDAEASDGRQSADGRRASRHLARVTAGFLLLVDALEAGDVDSARQAFRDAIWAPRGRSASNGDEA